MPVKTRLDSQCALCQFVRNPRAVLLLLYSCAMQHNYSCLLARRGIKEHSEVDIVRLCHALSLPHMRPSGCPATAPTSSGGLPWEEKQWTHKTEAVTTSMQAIAAGLLVGGSVAFHSLHRAIHEPSVSRTALFATVHVETTTGSANPMGPKASWQREALVIRLCASDLSELLGVVLSPGSKQYCGKRRVQLTSLARAQ